MSRRREDSDPDRFLLLRAGTYHYRRRVPTALIPLDTRAPMVRRSLGTKDLAKARLLRDAYEAADNDLWAAYTEGAPSDIARAKHRAATARAAALGFSYRPASALARDEDVSELLRRIEAAKIYGGVSPESGAALGHVEGGDLTITGALEQYLDTIAAARIRTKSEDQKTRWKNQRRLSVKTFVRLLGIDKRMDEITRRDAQKLHEFWLRRVAPETGAPTHTASAANRDFGNLRGLWREWWTYHGHKDRPNPFDGFWFDEKVKRRRPPFSTEFIRDRLLAAGALDGLNREARGIILVMVETGARPSEIAALTSSGIVLDHKVPHIRIEPSDDPEDPREIKTAAAVRAIPLVGAALETMRNFPDGFARYRDRAGALSALVNKYLRTRKLLETPRHRLYSLRHSFEDRMKNGGLDSELRRILMGHVIDRVSYGEGGSLEWRRDELAKIALPFAAEIVPLGPEPRPSSGRARGGRPAHPQGDDR